MSGGGVTFALTGPFAQCFFGLWPGKKEKGIKLMCDQVPVGMYKGSLEFTGSKMCDKSTSTQCCHDIVRFLSVVLTACLSIFTTSQIRGYFFWQ